MAILLDRRGDGEEDKKRVADRTADGATVEGGNDEGGREGDERDGGGDNPVFNLPL